MHVRALLSPSDVLVSSKKRASNSQAGGGGAQSRSRSSTHKKMEMEGERLDGNKKMEGKGWTGKG
eukprot:1158040-Pelagomonas_calceolata.AAC.7